MSVIIDILGEQDHGMASEERSSWVMVVVATTAYVIYLSLVLSESATLPLAPSVYGWPLLGTILGAIVVAVLAEIGLAIVDGLRGRKTGRRDERDRRIDQLGEYTGQAFVVVGALAAMILAILEVDSFWIANAVYLAFVLSAVLGSITKIALYRGGLPTW
jgi:uncharacterized integral membrane protein